LLCQDPDESAENKLKYWRDNKPVINIDTVKKFLERRRIALALFKKRHWECFNQT